jgi:hypothetical protein
MLRYPANGVYGNFGLTSLNPYSTPVDNVSSGPNTGLSYLTTKPPFIATGAEVYTHPVLYPPGAGTAWGHTDYPLWYNDQNGRPSGTCTQAHVPSLRGEVERHEGLTLATNSHAGVANQEFTITKPHETLERLYRFRVTSQQLHDAAFAEYRRFILGPNAAAQSAFDVSDYPLIAASLPCLFDLNPTNP